MGDNPEKSRLIPHVVEGLMIRKPKLGIRKDLAQEEEPASYQLVGEVTAHQGLRVAGLRGRPATLELRHGPDTYGWQQSRIFLNGGNPEGATPRGG